MNEIFFELSIILVVATLISGLMLVLKQPLIMGHIITGLLVGPYAFNVLHSSEIVELLAQLGIALLLFIIGLNLSPRVVREVGKIAVLTGIGQIIFTSIIGIAISVVLGFSFIASLYISIGMTLSSTIIVLKLLSDKKDLTKLYAKIAIGFLLVQDIAASLILLGVSSFSRGGDIVHLALRTLIMGILLTVVFTLISMYVLPRISHVFAHSQEFLFLFALGWGLGVASLIYYLGFSLEIGALVAGVTLSVSPYQFEISAKLRPLRDFFIILFFVLLGSQLVLVNISSIIVPALVLSLFVLVGNPLIVMILMGLLGYNKKTSFMSSITVAQISEFSLILAALGLKMGHLQQETVTLLTIIGLITIAGSTYLIMHAERLYNHLAPYLSIFERKKHQRVLTEDDSHDILLFGYNRVGYDFAEVFQRMKRHFLVIDYDPEVIKQLSATRVHYRYGDARDSEFLNELNLDNVHMLVSTVPDFETNLFIVNKLRDVNKRAIAIVISHSIADTETLYKYGATYVVMPHFLGAHHAAHMISQFGFDIKKFKKERTKHFKILQKRKKLGHEHPIPESLR